MEFWQADVQVHDLGTAAYDLVVSRTGTMFFGDPEPRHQPGHGHQAGRSARGARVARHRREQWLRES